MSTVPGPQDAPSTASVGSPGPLLPEDALGDEIARLAAHLDAATHRLLTCVRRFDESGAWHDQGAVSCAHWLTWRIGLDPVTAREKVRVARALGALPLIDDALRVGALSYAKIRAMTRIATPQNEARLLELARHSTGAQLERLCRAFRRVSDQLQAEGDFLDDRRYVHDQVLPTGMVRITAGLHADEAALVMKAIEAARLPPGQDGPCFAPTTAAPASVTTTAAPASVSTTAAPASVSTTAAPASAAGAGSEAPDAATPRASDAAADEPPPTPARDRPRVLHKADALVHVAESFLSQQEVTDRRGPRYQVVVHLEPSLLDADGTYAATLDDGTRLSSEAFRRISCDAVLLPHGAPGGSAASGPGRRGGRARTASGALRRALEARDRGCRFPGCPHRLFLHAHHLHHWAHGGTTTADNLVLLCTAHHRMVHEGGVRIERGQAPGELVFRDRAGRLARMAALELPPVEDGAAALMHWNRENGLLIDELTGLTEWNGDPMEYDEALAALLAVAKAS
jgi:hypothetical protein